MLFNHDNDDNNNDKYSHNNNDDHINKQEGNTALHFAAMNGHPDVVEWLIIEAGAKLSALNSCGNSPLHVSAGNGHLNVVQYIVGILSDAHIQNNEGDTPLHLATLSEHFDVADLLWKSRG
jgi:ankyrin repeat protein